MMISLRHEFYKFVHQKLPVYGFAVLFILMLYTAITGENNNTMFVQCFGMGQWSIVILIAIASDFLTMEYRNNTIDTLFYKTSNKFKIYLSKFLVIVSYGMTLLTTGALVTIIFSFIFANHHLPWLESFNGQHTILISLLLNIMGYFFYMLFVVALSFLLICWLQSNSLIIVIGLLFVFLGSNISTSIMKNIPSSVVFMKWNPLNMVYVINQLSTKKYVVFSNLNDLQIIVGTLVYSFIFFIVGYFIFNHRQA